MATTPVSVEEYLRSSYEPDAEYVDGVLEERPAREGPHSEWQATLIMFLRVRRRELKIRVRPEIRTQTGERRYRVADIEILDATLPR